MKRITILFTFLALSIFINAQDKCVAITMDDLFIAYNNISIKEVEQKSDSLLNTITKLNIPVTVFVNEKSVLKENEIDKRLELYTKWVNNPLITIGNHTYSHKNCAETELSLFEDDIIKGETLSRDLLKQANKELKYFRFPFNCTGKDSASRADVFSFLEKKGYIVAPFTIESGDYMFNALYCNYLNKGMINEANQIIEKYIDFTVELFQYFEGLTNQLYGRNINHVYLCHTNLLNTACIDKLVMRLKEKGYKFISFDKALEDEVYKSKDYYTNRYGISWIYRWIKNNDDRKKLMRQEPYLKEIEEQYEAL